MSTPPWEPEAIEHIRQHVIDNSIRVDDRMQHLIGTKPPGRGRNARYCIRRNAGPTAINPSHPWEVEYAVDHDEISARGVRSFPTWHAAITWVTQKMQTTYEGPD